MAKDDRQLSTSRMVRGGAFTRLAVGQVARDAGAQVSTIGQRRDVRRQRREEAAVGAAEQLVNVLGSMKGGGAKVGQMLSMVDLSGLPRAYRVPLQARLGSLCDSVPEVEFGHMRRQIEDGTGGSLSAIFSEFDSDPVGSASIGQVYRATLRDGRDVAVKVKYPGIDQAVEADIKNLVAFARFWRRALPGVAVEAFVAEVREALQNELAYEAEAVNQHRAAMLYAGHPFIVVPDSVGEFSGSNVLVTEWFDGKRSDSWEALGQPDRDRLGEILFRFYVGGIYRNREFCADPHPGNVLLRSDGTVGFIDFGAYKFMTEADVAFEAAVWNAAAGRDAQKLHKLVVAHGLIEASGPVDPHQCLDYALHAYGWQTSDKVTVAEGADRAILQMFDPRIEEFDDFRQQLLPPAHLISRRVDLFTAAMLRRLRASANWYAIGSEWMSGAQPATELGRLEHEWLASCARK